MPHEYRGSQIARPRQYGLFRDPGWRNSRRPDWRSTREGMDPGHLVLIRKLPCAVCPSFSDIEAHHLKSGNARKHRSLGVKAPDRYAVPLCRWLHHAEVERIGSRREEEWFLGHGINPHELANALWKAETLEAMQKVLAAHKHPTPNRLETRK